jgi:hypothetical protein
VADEPNDEVLPAHLELLNARKYGDVKLAYQCGRAAGCQPAGLVQLGPDLDLSPERVSSDCSTSVSRAGTPEGDSRSPANRLRQDWFSASRNRARGILAGSRPQSGRVSASSKG